MKVTANADKRYYLDEKNIVHPDAVITTMEIFNAAKIGLYDAFYDKKYKAAGPLTEISYASWLKETFHVNAYYAAPIVRYANAALSSQTELHQMYIRNGFEDIKTRKGKITATEEDLAKKKAVKNSIREYILSGKWIKPYPKCRLKVCGKKICLPGAKEIPFTEYERKVEQDIRSLKNRLSMLRFGLQRAEAKQQARIDHPPKKIVFGTKDYYRQKDEAGERISLWKEEFFFRRHRSMSLTGRSDAKGGNFLVRMEGSDLVVTCLDGTKTRFCDFQLTRYAEEWKENLVADRSDRKPLCYNFVLHKDEHGRKYLILSVTMELDDPYVNHSFSDGCVSMDINYDIIAVSDISKKGDRIGGAVFPFDIRGRSSGQVSEIIGRTMAKVGKFCADRKKPLVMEDIDLILKRNGLRYGPAKRNRHVSLFAYAKITACIHNQGYKQKFAVIEINPAYTSQIGKFLYMKKLGISIHEAASYAIGLKGMEMLDKLLPDKRMYALLSEPARNRYEEKKDTTSVMGLWRMIYRAFQGVNTHMFYRNIPYEVLKEKKRPTLRTLSSEMKRWQEPEYVC